jgi:hypothetical protein
MEEREVRVSVGAVELEGNLDIPEDAQGIVLFAHGSGSGRHSPRNRYVAEVLRKAGLATLLVDLLTLEEEEVDLRTRTSASTSGCLPTGSRARPTGWRRTRTRNGKRLKDLALDEYFLWPAQTPRRMDLFEAGERLAQIRTSAGWPDDRYGACQLLTLD